MQDIPQDRIDPAERISRYLLYHRLFNLNSGRVYPQAFEPKAPKIDGEVYETSVYRTEGVTEADTWSIGNDYVTKLRPDNLPVLARADTQASKILAADLKIDPNGVPHPRHANIINWPDDKEARQMKKLLLAQSAKLVPRG